MRSLINYLVVILDKDLCRALIPLNDTRVWNKRGFMDMNKQAWASFANKVAGWWAFDIFTLLASSLTTTDTAAQTIMRTASIYTFMIPFGFSNAMNFLIGKYIGKNRVDLAK